MSEDKSEHDDKGFRVVDRRRFTSSGEVKTDGPAETPEPAAAEKPQNGRGKDRERQKAEPRERGRAEEPVAPEPGGEPIDFLSFVASLATNALAAMGALPPEQSQGLPRSPELAREYIDIITMLKEKTRGNLSAREEQAMQQLLTDLRLQFVESSRRPAPGRR